MIGKAAGAGARRSSRDSMPTASRPIGPAAARRCGSVRPRSTGRRLRRTRQAAALRGAGRSPARPRRSRTRDSVARKLSVQMRQNSCVLLSCRADAASRRRPPAGCATRRRAACALSVRQKARSRAQQSRRGRPHGVRITIGGTSAKRHARRSLRRRSSCAAIAVSGTELDEAAAAPARRSYLRSTLVGSSIQATPRCRRKPRNAARRVLEQRPHDPDAAVEQRRRRHAGEPAPVAARRAHGHRLELVVARMAGEDEIGRLRLRPPRQAGGSAPRALRRQGRSPAFRRSSASGAVRDAMRRARARATPAASSADSVRSP